MGSGDWFKGREEIVVKSSSLCSGVSEIIVCQSKTTLCCSTAAPSPEFILRGRMGDTEDITLDKSKEGIKEKTEGDVSGVWFEKMEAKNLCCAIRKAWMDPCNQYQNVFEGETSTGCPQDSFRNLFSWTEIGKCGKLNLRTALVSPPIMFPPLWACI